MALPLLIGAIAPVLISKIAEKVTERREDRAAEAASAKAEAAAAEAAAAEKAAGENAAAELLSVLMAITGLNSTNIPILGGSTLGDSDLI